METSRPLISNSRLSPPPTPVGFPGGSNHKVSAGNAGDAVLIPGEGNGNPLQCSSLKVKAAQSCLTLCDPMNYTVHAIL